MHFKNSSKIVQITYLDGKYFSNSAYRMINVFKYFKTFGLNIKVTIISNFWGQNSCTK